MGNELWLALAIVFIIEGIMPLLLPKQWQQMLSLITQQPADKVRKYAGCLVVTGVVLLFML
ncbi:DUF2065 family protein [Moritella sp.]|uniref:DUF2065 domain-containing protein n=1 Tax=Moritella sp. TaxID=78556 RepID=UPI001D746E6D|nr:DUF2065 family protein [Moritella sp.]MCJ8350140.1 DUF2065 family protein [Moritella sp.]NQZ40919.1 DUF2065 family protein [Moritella sp.]NQZ50899.1 DUF2065 family protein [Moritella sp.]